MNFMDARTRNALWLFAILCGVAAFILITSFRDAPPPPEKPPVDQRQR